MACGDHGKIFPAITSKPSCPWPHVVRLTAGHTRLQCQLNTRWVSSWGNSGAHDLESVALKTIGVIVESTDIFVWLCNACLCGSGVSLFYFQPVNTEVWQACFPAPSANGAGSATPWRLRGARAQRRPSERVPKPRGGPEPGCHKLTGSLHSDSVPQAERAGRICWCGQVAFAKLACRLLLPLTWIFSMHTIHVAPQADH